MNDDKETRARFATVMLGVAENYGQTITATGCSLRFRALQAYTLEEIEAAAMSIMYSRKYTSMPTVADFIEHLGGGSIEDLAEIEAGKALWAIGRVGRYDSVVFDDPTTMAVIQNGYGGWPKLCEECGAAEPERWFRRNFAKMWAAYRRQGVRLFGVLPGVHEVANAAGGQAAFIPGPRLLGDEEKARNVLAMGAGEPQRRLTPLAGGEAAFVGDVVPGGGAALPGEGTALSVCGTALPVCGSALSDSGAVLSGGLAGWGASQRSAGEVREAAQ